MDARSRNKREAIRFFYQVATAGADLGISAPKDEMDALVAFVTKPKKKLSYTTYKEWRKALTMAWWCVWTNSDTTTEGKEPLLPKGVEPAINGIKQWAFFYVREECNNHAVNRRPTDAETFNCRQENVHYAFRRKRGERLYSVALPNRARTHRGIDV